MLIIIGIDNLVTIGIFEDEITDTFCSKLRIFLQIFFCVVCANHFEHIHIAHRTTNDVSDDIAPFCTSLAVCQLCLVIGK